MLLKSKNISFLDFTNKVDHVPHAKTDLAQTAEELNQLASALLEINQRRTNHQIPFKQIDARLYQLNANYLKRKITDGQEIVDAFIHQQISLEITHIPFSSIQSHHHLHPHAENIKKNIAVILAGIFKHNGFNNEKQFYFNYIFNEVFFNSRKYQALALGLLEDSPEHIRKHIVAAIEEAIKKEQANLIDKKMQVSLLIEQTPDFLILTVYSPYITAKKLDNILHSATKLAPKNIIEIEKEVGAISECKGLGIPLTIKMLNAEFPGSFYISNNESNEQGYSKILLKKNIPESESINQEVSN